jgi:hypothetical protein
MTKFAARARLGAGVIAAAGVLAVGAALAQGGAAALPAGLQRLLDCRSVSADSARLACYDAAVSELGRLLASGQIVAVDQEQVVKVRRQAFGFSLPSLSLFDRSDKPEELDRVSAVVDRAYHSGDGAWVIELEGGGVWRQIDSEPLGRAPRKGSKVDIRKAAMGSFFMNIDGQRAIRTKRVE